MSWGALPFWIYQVEYEQFLMQLSCAFSSEIASGTSKFLPAYNQKLIHDRKFTS